jgi:hypothetical protein
MSAFHFGLHDSHLTARADKIAAKHGAWHINYTEPGTGRRRGWFACRNMGHPFDNATANAVLADIEAAGGFEALTLRARRLR